MQNPSKTHDFSRFFALFVGETRPEQGFPENTHNQAKIEGF